MIKKSDKEFLPLWGWWVIIGFLAVLVFLFLLASGFFVALGHGLAALAVGLLRLAAWLVIPMLYFLPAIIGNSSPRSSAIFLTNLFFGWTGIGWVIALIWAVAEQGSQSDKRGRIAR